MRNNAELFTLFTILERRTFRNIVAKSSRMEINYNKYILFTSKYQWNKSCYQMIGTNTIAHNQQWNQIMAKVSQPENDSCITRWKL